MKNKFTRRDFLKAASLATASALALSCGTITDTLPASPDKADSTATDNPPSPANGSREADVIVLGAGISGLAVARTLTDNGASVIVLEARDRIGGRIWTDHSLGLPLDLGASWIHGINGNPIAALAKQFGAQTVATDYENAVTFDANGRELSVQEEEAIVALFDSIYKEVATMQDETDNDMPLQTAFDEVIASRDLSADELRNLEFYIHGQFALEGGADPQDLSLWEWDQDSEFDGEDVVFPAGYEQIINGLAKGLDIRLNAQAYSISYDASGVDVDTEAGAFSANKIAVTIPLGALKQNAVTFDPPLPAWKQSAIDNLGMGLLDKIYLKFPETFWDEKIEGFGYIGEQLGEWSDWMSFVPYANQPILLAFYGGAKGFEHETRSDAEIVTGAMKTLRVMYGDAIPEPDGFLITRWGQDALTLGAYSHVPPFASGKDYDALFKSVDGVLFFAGEATSREYPATVHGAYLSGVAAAEEMG